jgi:hypothetical protein
MGALEVNGGLSDNAIAPKFLYFEADGVNAF